jgi:PTS system nitrogen regulatory IIA component
MKEKKYLTPKDVSDLLGLPLITIQRWEHQGKIPFKIINQKRRYKKKEIKEWAKAHDFTIKIPPDAKTTQTPGILSESIKRGGIYAGIDGHDVYTVFEKAIAHLSFIPFIDRERLFNELLYREELASTGIGKGVAIPHTRSRLDLGLTKPAVSVFFLKNEIEFNAVDGLPVKVLFMIFTANTKDHLKILSKISFLLGDEKLLAILSKQNKDKDLINTIVQLESNVKA